MTVAMGGACPRGNGGISSDQVVDSVSRLKVSDSIVQDSAPGNNLQRSREEEDQDSARPKAWKDIEDDLRATKGFMLVYQKQRNDVRLFL
jgi:hypothetical protein